MAASWEGLAVSASLLFRASFDIARPQEMDSEDTYRRLKTALMSGAAVEEGSERVAFSYPQNTPEGISQGVSLGGPPP